MGQFFSVASSDSSSGCCETKISALTEETIELDPRRWASRGGVVTSRATVRGVTYNINSCEYRIDLFIRISTWVLIQVGQASALTAEREPMGVEGACELFRTDRSEIDITRRSMAADIVCTALV